MHARTISTAHVVLVHVSIGENGPTGPLKVFLYVAQLPPHLLVSTLSSAQRPGGIYACMYIQMRIKVLDSARHASDAEQSLELAELLLVICDAEGQGIISDWRLYICENAFCLFSSSVKPARFACKLCKKSRREMYPLLAANAAE